MQAIMIIGRIPFWVKFLVVTIPFWGITKGCKKAEVDVEPPVIFMSDTDYFPQACDTVYVGETFLFKAKFTDNEELGAFSVDIHNNFDHHSHSTEATECTMDPIKQPGENVFLFIQSYSIPENSTTYVAEVLIEIPAGVETGDYHFFIALTDKEGWQTIRGTGIKILTRNQVN
jgi:hypothetical protein